MPVSVAQCTKLTDLALVQMTLHIGPRGMAAIFFAKGLSVFLSPTESADG